MSQAPALPPPQLGAAVPPALPSFVQHQLQPPPSIDVDDAAFGDVAEQLRNQVESGSALAPMDETGTRVLAAIFAHGGQRGVDVPVREKAATLLIEQAEFLPEDLLPTLRPRLLWLLADQAVGDHAVNLVLEIVATRDAQGQPVTTLGFEQWPALGKGILDQMGRCLAAGLEAEKRVLQLLRSLFDLAGGAGARAMLAAATGVEEAEAAAATPAPPPGSAASMRVADRLVRMLAHYLGHPAELLRLLALRVLMLLVEQDAEKLEVHTDMLTAALSHMLSGAVLRPMLVGGVRAALNE
jgi:hypothetical protein